METRLRTEALLIAGQIEVVAEMRTRILSCPDRENRGLFLGGVDSNK
jgi:hypothetical protein